MPDLEKNMDVGSDLAISLYGSSTKAAECTDCSQTIIIQNVRITPSKIEFLNVFDKNVLEHTIEIQNCGRKTATVRLPSPSYPDFTIKPLTRVLQLSSGMKITRTLTYVYNQYNALPVYSIPIFINEEKFGLQVCVSPPLAKITIVPALLDFGSVDVGHNVSRKTLKIMNSGSKPARFQVDLGGNQIQISVDPNKGVVQPHSDVEVRVEIASMEEGDFSMDFLIKCVGTHRVTVTGTVMLGKLEVCNLPSCEDFTLIEFPRTYYGTKSTQRLVVRNNSSTRTVFCAVFVNELNIEHPNSCFTFSPMDGRLEPREARVFTINYEPQITRILDSFHFAILKIKKLNNWKDMNVSDYPNGLFNTLREYQGTDTIRKRNYVGNVNPSICETVSGVLSTSCTKEGTPGSECSAESFESLMCEQVHDLEYVLKVCMHGEPEVVRVKCIPDAIKLNRLIVNESVIRVVTIQNDSKHLSIKFSYEKVAYIEAEPKDGFIQPNKSVEIKVTLTPCKLGLIETKIRLNLFHYIQPYDDGDSPVKVGTIKVKVTMKMKTVTTTPSPVINPGITPKYLREVGKHISNIKFDTKLSIPAITMDPLKRKELSNDTALIAFPNDRPKSLRPWTSHHPVQTIYACLPRVITSTETIQIRKQELETRALTHDCYKKYLTYTRMDALRAIHKNELPEYEITNIKRFLMHRYFLDLIGESGIKSSDGILDGFIPLTPLQLNNIVMDPTYIAIGMVAPYSKISRSFSISNKNTVSIRVYLVPEKQRFTFTNGEGRIIKPNSTKTIHFSYYSEYEGNHSLCIRVVINECHIFEITLFVQVVAKILLVQPNHMFFKANDGPYKFINMYNPLNVYIDYNWATGDTNYNIEPATGKIAPMKSMVCMITYDPLKNKSDNLDVRYMTSADSKHRFHARAEHPESKTSLCTENVHFGNVGMNLSETRTAVLWNMGNNCVAFAVPNAKPMLGMEIIPEVGILQSKGCQIFNIKLKTLHCMTFTTKVMININDKPTHEMTITGNVLFPQIHYAPNQMKMRKFPVTSYSRFMIHLENRSKAKTVMSFNFQEHNTCLISETKEGERYAKAEFVLEAEQIKSLYVYFDPCDVTSLWMNMPFVMNHILGPPVGPHLSAIKTTSYIKNPIYKLPPTINVLRIFMIVCESDFSISKLDIEFTYDPFDKDQGECLDTTTFTNNSERDLQFCIRTDTLWFPFVFEYKSGEPIKRYPWSVTFVLNPGESTTFAAKFTPNIPGNYHNSLQFYVRNDYADAVHNYIQLRATHVVPEILAPVLIYLEYIPLRFKFHKNVLIITKKHKAGCIVQAQCENVHLEIILHKVYHTLKEDKIQVSLIYSCDYCESFRTNLIFSCSCGIVAETACIGGSENSLFTIFRVIANYNEQMVISEAQSKLSDSNNCDDRSSHISANENISFPYFPDEGDKDLKLMTDIKSILESWLFCQGFNGKLRYTIPSCFTMLIPLPRIVTPEKKHVHRSQSEQNYVIPYLELLKYIGFKEIADNFAKEITPKQERERAQHLFCLYYNILEYLKANDAHLPHVLPELLLSYDDYTTYITSVKHDCGKLDHAEEHHTEYNFHLLSKQTWIDLLLQTLKIFVVGRIKLPKSTKNIIKITINSNVESNNTDLVQQCRSELSGKDMVFINHIEEDNFPQNQLLSESEYYLLNWMKHYYLNTIGLICKENVDILLAKSVEDFDYCFQDSLVLATVILAHCPYLRKCFVGLYWIPSSPEQYHHNAAVVIQTLNLVKSTFQLQPCDIYNANNIHMVLLVAYLYEFLPHLHPHTNITVIAKLATTSSIKISITNDNPFDVSYETQFFNNEHKCFAESRSSILVRSKSAENFTVKFTAKFIRQMKATLLLSGEVLGKRYAKSIVYNLVGEPDVTYATSSLFLGTKLYTSQEHAVEVQAPYKVMASYDIYITMTKPTSYKTLKLYDYAEILKEKMLYKFNFLSSQVFFNELGQTVFTIIGVAMTMRTRSVWIFLRNTEVGEFCIYSEMKSIPTKDVEILYVEIAFDLYTNKCTCNNKGANYCKKFVEIKIPNMNITLIESFKREFITWKADNKQFWTTYLDKPAAIRHMKKTLVKEYNCDILFLLHLLNDYRIYDITIKGVGKDVTYPLDLPMEEMVYGSPEVFTSFYMHVGTTPLPSTFTLEMYEDEFCEVRKYKVRIQQCRKSSTISRIKQRYELKSISE